MTSQLTGRWSATIGNRLRGAPGQPRIWRAPRATAGTTRFLLAKLGWTLLVAAVVTLGAAGLSWSRTPLYRASADVLVEPRTVPGVTTLQAPDMGTEKLIATSGDVIGLASRALDISPGDLNDAESVSVPVDTHVLRIAVTHPNPATAKLWAQTLAQAYVTYRTTSQPARPADLSKSAVEPAATVPAEIITPAGLPVDPVSPNHAVDLSVAVVLGLSLGIGTAFLRDRFDDRVRGAADLEARVGAPILALLPPFRRRGGPPGRLVVGTGPDSPVAEAYRNLRARILQAAKRRQARTVVATSPARTGTGTVAANLAAALALSGRRVVLVCAQLRRPGTHDIFGVPGLPGLTDVVGGQVTVRDALRSTAIGHLTVLPAGRATDDPGAVLQSPGLVSVLHELRRHADLVIIEAPPVLAGADTVTLTEVADLVVLVGDARRTTRTEVRGANIQLEPVRDKVIGCVLDNVGRTRRLRRLGPPTLPPDDDTILLPPNGGPPLAPPPLLYNDPRLLQPRNNIAIPGR
jgi:tyrosine-protein kinase